MFCFHLLNQHSVKILFAEHDNFVDTYLSFSPCNMFFSVKMFHNYLPIIVPTVKCSLNIAVKGIYFRITC